jgi:hypothetical protein
MGIYRPGRPLFDLLSPLSQQQRLNPSRESGRGKQPNRTLIAILTLLVSITTGVAFAQTNAAQSLAERSTIVLRGKVLKTNASDEPLLAPSNMTVIVAVQQMYSGQEIAGDQTGRTVTVILSRAEAIKEGEEMTFFGNPRFLGTTLTMADEGEMPAQTAVAMDRTALAHRDLLVSHRLGAATLVFRGTVESVHPLEEAVAEPKGKRSPERTSEHDPEWEVATVRIVNALRGGAAGQNVTLVFAASRDITWFNSPKLKPGQDAVFLAHTLTKDEEAMHRGSALLKFLEKQSIYLVTEPFDVLPSGDEDRVRSLLATPKETK